MNRKSKLQQKLMATGQLKVQEDNSAMVEKVMEAKPKIERTPPVKVMDERIEDMTEEIETMLKEMTTQVIETLPFPETIVNPLNLMKLKKTELITMAETMGCVVSGKNTKRQIIAAIEKQSA